MSSLELRRSALLVRKHLLQTMPAELTRDLEQVAEQNGRELFQAIAFAAPMSDDEDPGQLKRSVGYKREGLKVTVSAGGGDASHATYQEFGTRHMRAQPFFYPVYRLKKKKLMARYGKVLTKIAKKFGA